MTSNCDTAGFDARARGASFGAAFLSGLIEAVTRHSAERQAARTLLRMDDHLLRDIGVSRADVENLVRSGRARHDDDAPRGVWRTTR